MSTICIFGAGAIGGLMAAHLSAAGEDVAIVARGPHLEAMRRNGLKVIGKSGTLHARPRILEGAEETPPDFLVLTLKAHSLQAALPAIRPLVGPRTTIVAAVNGVPWWYFHGVGGELEGRIVRSVDPDGALWEALPPARTIGCVVHPAAEIVEPGVIEHSYGDRFSIGPAAPGSDLPVETFSRMLIGAGLKSPIRRDIREELWVKLWGNMAFNPVSALTGATLDVLLSDPGTLKVVRDMMLEGQAVAGALGVRLAIDVDRRIEGGRSVGAHRTSMLQDFDAGRPTEIEALLGAVVEIAGWLDVPTPISSAILALVRQKETIRRGLSA